MTSDSAIEKTLDLLDAIARSAGSESLPEIASSLGLPLSTAYRLLDPLLTRRMVVRVGRGRYMGGGALERLSLFADQDRVLAHIARPVVRGLARRHRLTVHLGIWDEEMMTYLVKESFDGRTLFTQEMGQLEAYCSAVGRAVLAYLPEPEIKSYLADGPFVALTEQTAVLPESIAEILLETRERGFALENGEIAERLRCLAVPVRDPQGITIAGLSIATMEPGRDLLRFVSALQRCSLSITSRLSAAGALPDQH